VSGEGRSLAWSIGWLCQVDMGLVIVTSIIGYTSTSSLERFASRSREAAKPILDAYT
jgi:hypothetical protein